MKKLILVGMLTMGTAQADFNIQGDRLDYPLPSNAKLAQITGSPTGEYLLKYVEKNDKVGSWKTYAMGNQRIKMSFDDALSSTIADIKENCPNVKADIFKSDKKGDSDFVVLQYFCPTASKNAPYGEGAVMGFYGDGDYTFKAWSSWRPQSADLGSNQLGISNDRLGQFKALATLGHVCNPAEGKICQFNSLLNTEVAK